MCANAHVNIHMQTDINQSPSLSYMHAFSSHVTVKDLSWSYN